MLTKPERAFVDVTGRLPYCWRFKLPIERRLGRHKLAAGLAGSKVIFTNSAYTRELLAATFPTVRTQSVVSWPGVAELFFRAPNATGAPRSGPFRLLTVARLCHTKNIGNVLRALALVKDEVDFTYTVVGDGYLRQELEHLAENLKIDRQTVFRGSLAAPDVVSALDVSDLLLLPSLGESFGIAYAEAAARGVPSLASKTGGAMDAVVEGVNGIIVDGPEPSQIADGIRRFSQMRPRPDREEIRRFALQFRRRDIVARLRDTVLGSA
jgi:glycosyltransferase involved in cell wall biosynthesis